MSSNSSAGDRITFFLIGAGIGATLAILFAPKPGKELRHDIADLSRRTYGKGADVARKVGDRVVHGVETVRNVAKGTAQGAYEAGKQSFQEERDRNET